MQDLIKRYKTPVVVLAALCCLILFSRVWSASAPFRGEMDARWHVAMGHYEVMGYGLPGPWRHEYVRLLRERYGIRFRTLALCIVSEDLRAYADNYNKVSAAAANGRFKHDVFKECAEEAEKRWRMSRDQLNDGY